MLTNKKITVYIIMLSLFMASCTNENNTNEVIDNKEIIKNISGEKSKALWGEAEGEGGINISISDWIDTEASQEPDFIR